MSCEFRERARLLFDRSLVEGISLEDQRWLQSHLAECSECSRYAEVSRRAIQALGAFAFDVDPAAARRVQEAVSAHASKHSDSSIGVFAALGLTVAGSAAVWIPAGWMAARWHWPVPGWQIGFAVFWLLPSVLLTALLLFRKRLVGHTTQEGDAI